MSPGRHWKRFGSDVDQVNVWLSSTDVRPAQVTDESMTGIGLLLDSINGLCLEQRVELEYNEVRMPATIRQVRTLDDGRHHLGLQWDPPPGSRSELP